MYVRIQMKLTQHRIAFQIYWVVFSSICSVIIHKSTQSFGYLLETDGSTIMQMNLKLRLVSRCLLRYLFLHSCLCAYWWVVLRLQSFSMDFTKVRPWNFIAHAQLLVSEKCNLGTIAKICLLLLYHPVSPYSVHTCSPVHLPMGSLPPMDALH